MTGPFGEELWWYVARAGGIVALVLAAASVVWGLLLSSRYLQGAARPAWLLDLHRFLGGLTVIFTAIHVLGLYLDSYVDFAVAELLIPFRSHWRPAEVAAGVVAGWLLLAVQGTSLVMKRLPRTLWKWVHLTSYLMLVFGAVHGITAGTDAGSRWYRILSGGIMALVLHLTVWRALNRPARRQAVAKTVEVA